MVLTYQADRAVLLKILLHAAGHPSQAVNGILLGKMPLRHGQKSNEPTSPREADNTVQILDVLPFFHTFLSLAPTLEVALIQADVYAQKQGLSLVGYYHANERIDDLDLGPAARKIADKIYANTPQSCALLVDNSRLQGYLQGEAKHFLQIYLKDAQKGIWSQSSSEISSDSATVPQLFLDYHSQGRHHEVVDFDDHLNDIRKDWTNASLLS